MIKLTPSQIGIISGSAVILLVLAAGAYLYFYQVSHPQPTAPVSHYSTQGLAKEAGPDGVFIRINQLIPLPTPPTNQNGSIQVNPGDIGKTDLSQVE